MPEPPAPLSPEVAAEVQRLLCRQRRWLWVIAAGIALTVFGYLCSPLCKAGAPAKDAGLGDNRSSVDPAADCDPCWWSRLTMPSAEVSFLPAPLYAYTDSGPCSPRWTIFSLLHSLPAGPPQPVLDSGPVLVEFFAPGSTERPALAEVRIRQVFIPNHTWFEYSSISRCTTDVIVPPNDVVNTVWARWSPLPRRGRLPPYASPSDTGWVVFPLSDISYLLGHLDAPARQIPRP